MSSEVVTLTAEINVGDLVVLRTESVEPYSWVVVKVGKWWPNAGKVKIVRRRDRSVGWSKWVYPCELRKVSDDATE